MLDTVQYVQFASQLTSMSVLSFADHDFVTQPLQSLLSWQLGLQLEPKLQYCLRHWTDFND